MNQNKRATPDQQKLVTEDMATLAEKLADSLEVLQALQRKTKCVVLKGVTQISRTHLKRLLDAGYLQEVLKGWYIASRPGAEGDTTVWYTSYWYFVVTYLNDRFGDEWCLSPEQSLDLYAGKTTIPTQSVVRSPKGSNNLISLMYDSTLFDLKADLPQTLHKHSVYGVNMYTLAEALVYASPSYFQNEEVAARTCLAQVKEVTDILRLVADAGATSRAGRLAGAFRNMGNDRLADTLMGFMQKLGHKVVEEDPFVEKLAAPFVFEPSPYAARIRLMWQRMRQTVIDVFPEAPGIQRDVDAYLRTVDEKYLEDAYHSLSIEGYRVSPELIAKVRSGSWKPESDDLEHKNALVARGYFQAFRAVRETIAAILSGRNSGEAAEADHGNWYMEMWLPFVEANLLRPSDLLGYRRSQVYIRGSQHIPLPADAVNDAMEVLFSLLKTEEVPAVRAVLGHFFFVFIHPYMDGNGRNGRFLLNVMLASGGYNWTVIPLGHRDDYLRALELASVKGDISEFAQVIASLLLV